VPSHATAVSIVFGVVVPALDACTTSIEIEVELGGQSYTLAGSSKTYADNIAYTLPVALLLPWEKCR
jgi:hypothetical protein